MGKGGGKVAGKGGSFTRLVAMRRPYRRAGRMRRARRVCVRADGAEAGRAVRIRGGGRPG